MKHLIVLVAVLIAACSTAPEQRGPSPRIEASCPSPLLFKEMDDRHWRSIYAQCRNAALDPEPHRKPIGVLD